MGQAIGRCRRTTQQRIEQAFLEIVLLKLVLESGFAELLISHRVEVHRMGDAVDVHKHLRSKKDEKFFTVHDFVAAAEKVAKQRDVPQERHFPNTLVVRGADQAAKENRLAALDAHSGRGTALINDWC